jgi:hypothetical protein
MIPVQPTVDRADEANAEPDAALHEAPPGSAVNRASRQAYRESLAAARKVSQDRARREDAARSHAVMNPEAQRLPH